MSGVFKAASQDGFDLDKATSRVFRTNTYPLNRVLCAKDERLGERDEEERS